MAVKKTLSKLPISKVLVDPKYQRPNNPRHVKRIAGAWDDDLAGAIEVNKRSDGTYYVFNGSHRLAAARKAGRRQILSLVHYGLSVKQEASLFHMKDRQSVKLKPTDRFRAALAGGDVSAISIDNIVSSQGFTLDLSGRQHDLPPLTIGAIAALENVYKRYGATGLTETLRTIRLCWPTTRSAASSALLNGVAAVLQEDNPPRNLLKATLRHYGVKGVSHEAQKAFIHDNPTTNASHGYTHVYQAIKKLMRKYERSLEAA